MRKPTPRLAVPLALAALLIAGGTLFVASTPAEAQCLSAGECDALRAQLEDFRRQAKAQKHRLRELQQQIRALPQGSPERRALKEQARSLRRQASERRRQARPVMERFRQGCKNC